MAVDRKLDRLIRDAIANKHLLRFRYKGNERVAEPHDYGIQKRTIRLLCWQVGGRSGGRIPGWRLIDVADMQDCEVLDPSFAGNREVPSGTHHRWEKVFIRVGPPAKA